MVDHELPSRQRTVLLSAVVCSLPAFVFLFGMILRWVFPPQGLVQSQLVYDVTGLATVWGAVLSLPCSPLVVAIAYVNRSRVESRGSTVLVMLSAIALFPIGMAALYVIGLSSL